ncbi:MAG: transposase [Oscillospiraceae bacterium]
MQKITNRYVGVKIDKYVIMPNHIHLILRSFHDHIIRGERECQKTKNGCGSCLAQTPQ